MNNYTYATDRIKSEIFIQDAIELYSPGAEPKQNRIPCPIHQGDDYNFSYTDKLFYCFVCGAGGDIIDFVKLLHNIGFRDAVTKLNDDFGLGCPLDRRMTLREQRDAQYRRNAIETDRQRRAAEKLARNKKYWQIWEEWARLDKNKIDFAPTSPCEEPHPLFVEALNKLGYQKYLLDSIELPD
ncbi:MAG: CHC2 zinc finger domain-containing protein [Christensenellales bacterium]